ncbi:uncharacterized protein LOC114943046, partial [Nylanderia fulva]|uniref:uncharacterized protein LOC114943046 n=1 Tax=Nylanderia fulva TaxID=613905 RepID=UPI0010FB1783
RDTRGKLVRRHDQSSLGRGGCISPSVSHPRLCYIEEEISPDVTRLIRTDFEGGSAYTGSSQELVNSSLPVDFDQWTLQEQYDHLINNINKYFPNIPESLRFVLPAIFKDGDCGRPANERPDWLDMDKFYRGQQFALRYLTGVALSGLMSLLMIFNFADGLKPLILSQKSNTPYRAFKRYLSTNRRFMNWYISDPWREGTQAYRDIQMVRKLHRNMREKLCKISDDQIDRESEITQLMCPAFKTIARDFEETCPTGKSWQCPYTMLRMKGLNQGDMSGTQFALMGLIVLYPEQFGVHNASEEDLEAFCHLWRGLGYLLGIEDQYNFCRGSLQDVRRRAEDFIEYWVKPNFPTVTAKWEHMSICVFEGIGFIALFKSYKAFLLYLCNVLKLDMPGLYKSLSWSETIMYWALKCLFFLLKFPDVSRIMNAIFHKDLNRATEFGTEKLATLEKKSSKIIQEFVVAL